MVNTGRRRAGTVGSDSVWMELGNSRLPLWRDFWQEEAWVSDYQAGEMVDRGGTCEGLEDWRALWICVLREADVKM